MKPNRAKNEISRVYFLYAGYVRGGGTTFFFSLIEYLLKFTDIKIGIIDFADGMMTRTAKKFFADEEIDYINYNDYLWNLADNSCIVTSSDRIGLVKKIKGQNIRILSYFWNVDIAWHLLFEPGVIKKLGRLYKKENATAFMSYGEHYYACKSFHKKFNKNYIPLFYHSDVKTNIKHVVKPNEINLVWLGRISGTKTSEIINIIENFDKYQTTRKKIFHIIGNGIDEAKIKSFAHQYKDNIDFRFTGLMVGQKLVNYLIKNTDIGIAMGTSALNFAALKIPVIAAHNPIKGIYRTNKFKWLFNMHEYSLGSPMQEKDADKARFENQELFSDMLDQIYNKTNYNKYGQKCYEYYQNTHGNLEFVGKEFLKALSRTTLTYKQLKKCFRFMPYDGASGIAVHTYTVFGLPIIKIRHHNYKLRVYFCGLEVIKKVTKNKHNVWHILGIKFSNTWWGRFSFPQSMSPAIREQCKDVYSINERIFQNEGRKTNDNE